MKYAIIGSGQIGTALVRIFACKNIEVGIANSRGPETIRSLAKEVGASVLPVSIEKAHQAEIIFLAVPFTSHKEVAEEFGDWNGKIIVDVTNALHVAPGALGARLSSEVVANAFSGARLVKAFNHLPAAQLGTNPSSPGQRQAIFVSGNDAGANAPVAAFDRLGLAPWTSEDSTRVVSPFMPSTAGPADFCFKTWRNSADCSSRSKSMRFRKRMLFKRPTASERHRKLREAVLTFRPQEAQLRSSSWDGTRPGLR